MNQEVIKWNKFSATTALHYAGMWEQCDKIWKILIFAVLRKRSVTGDALSSTMCNDEKILKAWPLIPATWDHFLFVNKKIC